MEREKVLEAMRGDMLLFGKICLPNMFTLPTPNFHREIAAALHDKTNVKMNFIAPRGHAKSSLVAGVAVLHHIFFDEGPKVILLISKTEGHANRLLQTIKNALDYSMPMRYLFGYYGEHSAKKWTTNEVVLKDGTYIVTRGTGQQVVGLKYNDQRPTLVILDDPEDLENTKTDDRMEGNLKWLLTNAVPGRDAQRGRICVIGTPQHQRSMVMVLKEMEGWKTLHYQALANEVMDDSKLQKDILEGRVEPKPEWTLWPEQWDAVKLLNEKNDLDSVGRVSYFYREYQCAIIGDEEQLFDEKDILTYRGELRLNASGEAVLCITHIDKDKLDEVDERPVNVFMGVDPASSVSQTADYSTIVPVAVDQMGNRFVLPYFRRRVKPMVLAEAIFEWYLKDRPSNTRIESVGYQEMLRGYLQEESEKRNLYIPGLEIKEIPRSAKSIRIEGLSPYFTRHQVFVLEGEMKELVDELVFYPRSRHDDLLDGLYYAFKHNWIPNHDSNLDKVKNENHDDEFEEDESLDYVWL